MTDVFKIIVKYRWKIIAKYRHLSPNGNRALENSQNSQENICTRVSFLIKLHASDLQILVKKRLKLRCFPVNFAKFLRAPFL